MRAARMNIHAHAIANVRAMSAHARRACAAARLHTHVCVDRAPCKWLILRADDGL